MRKETILSVERTVSIYRYFIYDRVGLIHTVGWYSVACIATRYGLDGIFCTCPPLEWVRGLLKRDEAAGRLEAKERVELYICSLCVFMAGYRLNNNLCLNTSLMQCQFHLSFRDTVNY